MASRPAPPDLVARLRAVPEATGVVVFSYKVHALGRAVAVGLGLPAVLRQHNLEADYHRALAGAARPPRSWATRVEALRIDRDERRLEHADWLTGIADISAADASMRARRAGVPVRHVPSFALGPGSAAPTGDWEPPADPAVVFLGALDVATNHDALRWFAAEVWPRVLGAVPGARWRVVGRKPTPWVSDLVRATPGAELHPDVEDPLAHLWSASLAVNPAVSGSGVNIKLVEYLAAGVPVVSTTRGAAGLGLAVGRDLLVADDADGFAGAVTRLLREPDTGRTLGRAGRATAGRILDVRTSLAHLDALLRPLPQRPG